MCWTYAADLPDFIRDLDEAAPRAGFMANNDADPGHATTGSRRNVEAAFDPHRVIHCQTIPFGHFRRLPILHTQHHFPPCRRRASTVTDRSANRLLLVVMHGAAAREADCSINFLAFGISHSCASGCRSGTADSASRHHNRVDAVVVNGRIEAFTKPSRNSLTTLPARWSGVRQAECHNAWNPQVAREIVLALPANAELTIERWIELARSPSSTLSLRDLRCSSSSTRRRVIEPG